MVRFGILLALFTLLAGTMVGCQRGDDNGSDDSAATAEDVLAAARTQWDDTETAQFTLAVDGEAFLDNDRTIRLRSAEGDILRPDSVSASASISVMLLTVDMSLIAVGGDMYMTNFVSGRWERAPDDFSYDPSILFSDSVGIGPILSGLQGPSLDGTERVRNSDTRKVTGTVNQDAVDDITAGAIQGESIPVTVWIGSDDNRIYRVTLTEPEGVSAEPATWTLDLSDHDEPVTIEPPPV